MYQQPTQIELATLDSMFLSFIFSGRTQPKVVLA